VVIIDDGVIGGNDITGFRIVAYRMVLESDLALPIISAVPSWLWQVAVPGSTDGQCPGSLIANVTFGIGINEVLARDFKLRCGLAEFAKDCRLVQREDRLRCGGYIACCPPSTDRKFAGRLLVTCCINWRIDGHPLKV